MKYTSNFGRNLLWVLLIVGGAITIVSVFWYFKLEHQKRQHVHEKVLHEARLKRANAAQMMHFRFFVAKTLEFVDVLVNKALAFAKRFVWLYLLIK